MKKFLLLVALVFMTLGVAQASFRKLNLGELSCSDPSLSGLMTFFPGAPNDDYSVTFTPGGSLADLISIGSGNFGDPQTVPFSIPGDESSGVSFGLELDVDSILEQGNFTGGTVTITASPGDSLTELTGFGTVSGTVTITNEGCTIETPAECRADFSTNGLQPVGASFQDDKHFKNHTKVVGPLIADLGGTITYAVSENQPKDLVNNRQTIVLTRNPNYSKIDDLREITFTGTTNYTKNVPVQLKITASDAANEVMSYEHPMKVAGPFGEPCDPNSERQFSITFVLDKATKRRPKPPAFKFAATGAGQVKAEVSRVSEPESPIMTTVTGFNISNTSMGKIGILPIGNPPKNNPNPTTKKLKRDARIFSNFLAKTIPDFMPLPSEAVTVTQLPFVTFRPVDISTINGAAAKSAQVAKNFRNLQRVISKSVDAKKKDGTVDILITVIDSDTFADLDESSPAAFAFVGSTDAPGNAFVQTVKPRSKFSAGAISQRVEDAVHEIAHSYGFIGNGDTICPPVIHNINSKFSDSCRITRRLRLSNVCKIDRAHIMGPSFPSTMITQCTYEDLVDRFKAVSVAKAANNRRALTNQAGTGSLQLEITVASDGSSASFNPIYDSEQDPSEFLSSASSTSWHLDLKNSGGSSITKLHFEFDPSQALPEASIESFILSKNIALLDGLASIDLVDDKGLVLASKTIVDEIPSVEIISADLSNSRKQATIDLAWSIVDNSGGETLTTVLVGSEPDEMVVYGDGFELEGSSATLTGIPSKPKIKHVQVLVTNGSRSTKSEIFNF